MSEKSINLMSNVKELVKENKFVEALEICEVILKSDKTNINALLMATKCMMDLNISPQKVKNSLEKVLSLKPKHPHATQGLRKFYETNWSLYFEDAINFYRDLHKTNELTAKDAKIVTNDIAKSKFFNKAEDFIIECLVYQMNDKSDEESIKTYFHISLEKYIKQKDASLFDNLFSRHLLDVDPSEASETIVYVLNMATFVRAVIAGKGAEDVFAIMTELKVQNAYASLLFARLLCDQYLMTDCEDTVTMGIDQLLTDHIYDYDALLEILINLRIENLIHYLDVDKLQNVWSLCDQSLIARSSWCQAVAVGFDAFRSSGISWADVQESWKSSMREHERWLCEAVMRGEGPLVEVSVLAGAPLTSFDWWLWAGQMRARGLPEEKAALEHGAKGELVFPRVFMDLAAIFSRKDDYSSAVKYLEKGLEQSFSSEMVEALVDLHMKWERYEEPLALLNLLEVDNCSDSLLLKFTKCLNHLDRITDAISLAQRIVKKCPNRSDCWQLLGDLYLKRGNINHAYKTYQKCVQLIGENGDNCARLGNTFSLSYQDTLDESEFRKSLSFFDRSLESEGSSSRMIAIEGKASVLFLHAEVSLKQLMLTAAISDINDIIKLFSDHREHLQEADFHMNMLGKTILLSIMGSVDKLIDIDLVRKVFFSDSKEEIDSYNLSLKCFDRSIQKGCLVSDCHFNSGLLELYRLNRKCGDMKRGQIVDASSYVRVESHLKKALSLNTKCADAWKYLGYLYLKHGVSSERSVFDIQHCLSTAINLTCDANRIKDVEAAFYLGLLYIQENWYDLAKEVFKKIQMDYPVDPVGHIGMYLLADKDHTVEEQPEVARALMSFVYRDESSNVNDTCYQLNECLVGLFAENMGFLIQGDNVIFDGRVDRSELVLALRTALMFAWNKYGAYSAVGCTFTEQEEIQYNEYGCFMGAMELLLGDQFCGKKLILESCTRSKSLSGSPLRDLVTLDELWSSTKHHDNIPALLMTVAKAAGLRLAEDTVTTGPSPQTTRALDELLLSAVLAHVSHKPRPLVVSRCVRAALEAICHGNCDRDVLLVLGSLILAADDASMATDFLQHLDPWREAAPGPGGEDGRLARILPRLQRLAGGPDRLPWLQARALRQPWSMSRWLTLLETGLAVGASPGPLLLQAARPWCMRVHDYLRYARLLARHEAALPAPLLAPLHRPMLLTAARLFPGPDLHRVVAACYPR